MSVLILSFLGFLFSGYISLTKLLTHSCALREACPYFLGYPACWYGFGMFSIIFITSIVSIHRKTNILYWIQLITAVLGVFFAGYFTLPEVTRLIFGHQYILGLPSCAYGLIFYILIFVFSIKALQNNNINQKNHHDKSTTI